MGYSNRSKGVAKMMKLMRRLSPRGPRADGGRYERQVDSSEDLNTMLSQSTAESLKERSEFDSGYVFQLGYGSSGSRRQRLEDEGNFSVALRPRVSLFCISAV